MAVSSKRVEAMLAKYAHLLGEGLQDEKGTKYDFGPKKTELEQKRHLFWVMNRDEPDTLGGFVLGNVIIDLIRTDGYDIDYIGLLSDSNRVRKRTVDGGNIQYDWVEDEDLTKPQQAVKAKMQKHMDKQDQRIREAQEVF